MSSTELSIPTAEIGIPNQTLQHLRAMAGTIAAADTPELIDMLIYADAIASIAREKRAIEIAREACNIRIIAARRMGELINAMNKPDRIWDLVPSRFYRCDELARIPQRLFKTTVQAMLDKNSSCLIPSVIRHAQISSLKQIESGIYKAYDDTFWVKVGSGSPSRVHYGGIENARHKLGLRKHPGRVKIDDMFSQARIAASTLSGLGETVTGEPRRLIGEAELAQAKVAELLSQALTALANQSQHA